MVRNQRHAKIMFNLDATFFILQQVKAENFADFGKDYSIITLLKRTMQEL